MTVALDGHNSYSNATPISTITLTTTQANDIIILIVNSSASTSGVSSTHTTGWTKRKTVVGGTTVDEWWGKAAAALSSETITITGASGYSIAVVFGISGADQSAVFDSNFGLPVSGSSDGLDNLISTDTANTFIFSYYAGANPTYTPGAGWTAIESPAFGLCEYQIASATQTNLDAVVSPASNNNLRLADAVMAIGSSGAPQQFNSGHSSANIILSGSPLLLTATNNVASANITFGREGVTSASLSGGNLGFYFEFLVSGSGFNSGTDNSSVGIGNTASGTSGFLGAGLDSIAWFPDGHWYSGNVQVGSAAPYDTSAGPVLLCICFDVVNGLIYGKVGTGGNYNNNPSANPTTQTGGVSLVQAGMTIMAHPMVPAAELSFLTSVVDAVTASFAQGSLTGAPPSLFIPFDFVTVGPLPVGDWTMLV
jgi:hypothetical protein